MGYKTLYKIIGSSLFLISGSLIEEYSHNTTQIYQLFTALALSVLGMFFIDLLTKEK